MHEYKYRKERLIVAIAARQAAAYSIARSEGKDAVPPEDAQRLVKLMADAFDSPESYADAHADEEMANAHQDLSLAYSLREADERCAELDE